MRELVLAALRQALDMTDYELRDREKDYENMSDKALLNLYSKVLIFWESKSED